MTIYTQTGGQRQVAAKSLTDTNDFDLIAPKPGATNTLESLVAVNKTAGSLTFDLIYVKGGVSVYVLHQQAIAAHTPFHLTDHNLAIPSGSILRVKASGSGIDVTAVHVLNHSGSKAP